MTITDIVIVVAIVLFLGVYVSWRAGRLDRMHTRLEAARAALASPLKNSRPCARRKARTVS